MITVPELCPDSKTVRPHIPAIERVIGRFDYSQLYYSTFFWVEGAWWRLKDQDLDQNRTNIKP